LNKWADENNADIVVVSTDGDFHGICERYPRLHHQQRLEKYLQEVGNFHEALLTFVSDITKQHRAEVEEAIAERFCQLGFYLEDQNGEVENINVSWVEIEDEIYMIRLNDDDEATLEFNARIAFTCDLQYDDMSTAIWDSEEKRYLYIDRASETDVERDEDVSVELRISFDPDDASRFEIAELEVNRGMDISVLQDTEYPYK
jgi:hypothetical protein